MKNRQLIVLFTLSIFILGIIPIIPTKATVPIAKSYWDFEEGSTSYVDDSGSFNHDGYAHSCTWVPGIDGDHALDLEVDDNGDEIRICDSDDYSFTDGSHDQAFSVSAWIKLESYSTWPCIVGKNDNRDGNAEWLLQITGYGHLRLLLLEKDESAWMEGWYHAPLSIGVVYFVCGTYDGSEDSSGIKVYIDGIDKTNCHQEIGSYDGMTNGNAALHIGSLEQDACFFDGIIDDVRIFDEELTTDEVECLFYNRNTPKGIYNNLDLYMPFDEDLGDNYIDETGNHEFYDASHPTWVSYNDRFGGALDFDGYWNYLQMIDGLQPRKGKTYSMWIKPVLLNNFHGLLSQTGVMAFTLTGGGGISFIVNTNNGWKGSDANDGVINTGQWYHVAAVIQNNGQIDLFVNGYELSTYNSHDKINDEIIQNGDACWIGHDGIHGGNFAGIMDEVRVYNRALWPEDILALYNCKRSTISGYLCQSEINRNLFGVTLELYKTDGTLIDKKITDENGFYQFEMVIQEKTYYEIESPDCHDIYSFGEINPTQSLPMDLDTLGLYRNSEMSYCITTWPDVDSGYILQGNNIEDMDLEWASGFQTIIPLEDPEIGKVEHSAVAFTNSFFIIHDYDYRQILQGGNGNNDPQKLYKYHSQVKEVSVEYKLFQYYYTDTNGQQHQTNEYVDNFDFIDLQPDAKPCVTNAKDANPTIDPKLKSVGKKLTKVLIDKIPDGASKKLIGITWDLISWADEAFDDETAVSYKSSNDDRIMTLKTKYTSGALWEDATICYPLENSGSQATLSMANDMTLNLPAKGKYKLEIHYSVTFQSVRKNHEKGYCGTPELVLFTEKTGLEYV